MIAPTVGVDDDVDSPTTGPATKPDSASAPTLEDVPPGPKPTAFDPRATPSTSFLASCFFLPPHVDERPQNETTTTTQQGKNRHVLDHEG